MSRVRLSPGPALPGRGDRAAEGREGQYRAPEDRETRYFDSEGKIFSKSKKLT